MPQGFVGEARQLPLLRGAVLAVGKTNHSFPTDFKTSGPGSFSMNDQSLLAAEVRRLTAKAASAADRADKAADRKNPHSRTRRNRYIEDG